jgi:hypothetical protein
MAERKVAETKERVTYQEYKDFTNEPKDDFYVRDKATGDVGKGTTAAEANENLSGAQKEKK